MGELSKSKLAELQRKKAIERQKELDKYLKEVQEYFEFIADEDEDENIEREEYWIQRIEEGTGLKDFTKTAEGRDITYMGNYDIKPAKCNLPLTQDHVDEFTYCAYHPIYTIRNYFKIVSSDQGVIPFRLYDFQEQQVRDFFKYNRILQLSSRQSGKCFHKDTTIDIIEEPKGIKKILNSLIKIIYPSILKSSNTISNFIYSRQKITVGDLIQKYQKDYIVGDDKFTGRYLTEDLSVKTPTGYSKVTQVFETIPYEEWVIKTSKGKELICADEHKLILSDKSEIFAQNLRIGNFIITEDGYEQVLSIVKTNKISEMYDLELDDENHVYYTNGLLSHNTTVSASVLLFYCIFNKNKNVGIIANKKATANEILDRIKLMYLNLPMWLKPGVLKWNEGRIEFSNGCKIITSATTAASIRGQSIACVDGSTLITVKSETTGVEDITIADLSERLVKDNKEFDIYYNGQTHITNTGDCKPEYYVLTPNGFSPFGGVVITHKKKTIKLLDYNLICTPDHKIKIDDVFVEAQTLPHVEYSEEQDVYDLVNVEKNNEYFTNRYISHNCLYIDELSFIPKKMWDAFYKSTFPVISASKLAKIICTTTPNGKDHFYYMWQDAIKGKSSFFPGKIIKWTDVPGRDEAWRKGALAELGNNEEAFLQEYECHFLSASVEYIKLDKLERMEKETTQPIFIDPTIKLHIFEQPIAKHDYVMTVDVSEGKGCDHQAFSVIDVTQMPLKVVATLKNNKLDTIEYARVIYQVALNYNEAHLIIENNFSEVAKDLWFNYEYTNLINFNASKSEQRQGKYFEVGIRTTPKVRRIGEEYFKHLVENNKIILSDIRIIAELNNLDYNEAKRRFEPRDESINDDLWAAFKCFCYVAKMMFFENLLKKGGLNLYSLGKESEEAMSDSLSFIIKPVVLETTSTPEKKKRFRDLAERRWERWI